MEFTKYLTLEDALTLLHQVCGHSDSFWVHAFTNKAQEAWLIVDKDALVQEFDNGEYELGVESSSFIASKFESLKTEGLVKDLDEYYESDYFGQHVEELKAKMQETLLYDWLADVTYEHIQNQVREFIREGGCDE